MTPFPDIDLFGPMRYGAAVAVLVLGVLALVVHQLIHEVRHG